MKNILATGSVGFLVKEIIDNSNKILTKKIKFKFGPRRPADIKLVLANSDRFNQTLNWKLKFNILQHMCKKAYTWGKKSVIKNLNFLINFF